MKKWFLLLVLLFSLNFTGWGQIANWVLTSNGNPSGVNENITATAFTAIGVGTLTFGASGAYADNWSTGAINTGKYFEISVTPNSGYIIKISAVNFGERRSSTGIRNYQVRWSIDNFSNSNTIATVSVPDNTEERTGNITGLDIDVVEGQTLKIRWYGYSAEATSGTWRINDNTLNLTGTVTTSGGNAITTGIVSSPPFCIDLTNTSAGTVAYTTTGTYSSATFTAYLSNASGDFSSPTNIGTTSVSGTDPSGSIDVTIPAGTSSGTGYKIRIDCDSPVITGSSSSVFEIANGANNVSGQAASIISGSSSLSWANPTGCVDEIMIVAKAGSAVTATPSGDGLAYTADLIYTQGTSFDGGYVVYKGTTSPQTVTGLTNGTEYYYTFFTRKGTNWSTGVTANATPATSSSATDYFRSKATGNWASTGTWESSPDGNDPWINATLTPDYNANSITILNDHTVSITANVTVDQVIIQSGGVLTHSGGTLTVNNGAGDDIIINDGGVFNLAATTPSYSSSATCSINTNGILRVSTTGMTGNGTGVNLANFIYGTGSILEYTSTSTFSSSGVTYFPNVDVNTIPIFRITALTSSPGGSNATVINGKIEANSSFTWNGTGTKTFRNGIIGTGTMSQSSNGQWIISGATAEIGGAGTLSLGVNGLVINSGSAVNITSNKTISGGTVNINATGSLTINSDAALTVTGTLTNSGDNTALVINEGGSLITNGTVSGGATITRMISGPAWHLMSAPVSSQSIFAGYTDMYAWDETNNLWLNDNGGSFPDASYLPGKGYLVSWAAGASKDFAGTLNSGDYPTGTGTVPALSYTTGKGSGYNLLGNPYPSALNGSIDTWTKTNVDNSIWVYYNGEYLTWNGSIGSLTGGIIPAMQGFWVKVSAEGAASLTIPNTARTHNAQFYYKSTESVQDVLLLNVEGNGYKDGIVVNFNNEATAAYDGRFDVRKMYGDAAAPQLYCRASDEELSIDVLPYSNSEVVVPLELKVGKDENYTISVKENTFFPTVTILLEDIQASKTINLQNEPSYSFAASVNDSPGRFNLHFGGTLGINDPKKDNDVTIYSAGNTLYISNNTGTIVKGDVFVYNLMGQQMMQQKLNEGALTKISLDAVTGYYLVKVITNQKAYSGKVFVQ